MDDGKAVDYTASDAEAALLALGPRLAWKEYSHGLSLAQVQDSGYYGVHRPVAISGDDKEWLAEFHNRGESYTRCTFSSNGAAKAACERHYATGKWE